MNINVTDYIMNLPELAEFDTMPAPLQQVISGLGAEWPSFPMINTHAVAGRKLIHVRLGQQLTEVELETMFASFGLDWQVWFIRSAYKISVTGQDENGVDILDYQAIKPLDKAALLPFHNDIFDGVDGNGDPIMRQPTLAYTLYLSAYAGTDPVEV